MSLRQTLYALLMVSVCVGAGAPLYADGAGLSPPSERRPSLESAPPGTAAPQGEATGKPGSSGSTPSAPAELSTAPAGEAGQGGLTTPGQNSSLEPASPAAGSVPQTQPAAVSAPSAATSGPASAAGSVPASAGGGAPSGTATGSTATSPILAGDSEASGGDTLTPPSDARWTTYCEDARKRPRYFTYCIDLLREEIRIPLHQARLMSPEQHLQVVVRYSEGPLKLEVRGQTGAYRPEVEQPMLSTGMKTANVGFQSGKDRLAVHTFSALLPGRVQLELTHKDTTRSYEVVVQKLLAGSLRVGVAFPTLEAVNRHYEAWTPPGSSTAEILEVGAAPVDVELVLGYKHFLKPVLEADSGIKPGIFFGMGLLDGADATLSLARSYYLGFDLGVPNFSVGVAAVLRQTDRLAGGLEAGDAIIDSQDIRLDTAWRFGVALVICPAPELFRVAR